MEGTDPDSASAALTAGVSADANAIITEMRTQKEQDRSIMDTQIDAKVEFQAKVLEYLAIIAAKGNEEQPTATGQIVTGDSGLNEKAPDTPKTDKLNKSTDALENATEGNTLGMMEVTAGLGALGSLMGENSGITKLMHVATLANTAATIANTFSQAFGGFGANGGVISSSGFVGLADGGVATQAMPYVIGEGRKNEAVVPLPNNREIPVVMKNDSNQGTVINHYDFSNADPASEARIRNMIEANGAQTFNKVFSEMDRGGMYAKKAGRRR